MIYRARRIKQLMIAAAILAISSANAVDEDGTGESSAASGNADDNRAIESLCSYVVGETKFAAFQDDFAGYFTRSTAGNPNAGPGELLKPLKWSKNVDLPADKSHLVMQMFGKEQVPAELTPYVTGAYVLGHPKPGTNALSYDHDPDSFNAIAVLQFKEGVLTQIEVPFCDE